MVEKVFFNGYTYRRYPNSKNASDRHYFKRSTKETALYLHREVWKFYNGEIPEGCHIHHKDGNTANNSIENLECVDPKEHSARHPFSEERQQKQKEHLARIRLLTKEWHASEEGHQWHVQNGANSYKNYVPVENICTQCGKTFLDKKIGGVSKFCSNNCKSAWRRASGIDNETRVCVYCGEEFITNKYSKAQHCSHACAVRNRHGK